MRIKYIFLLFILALSVFGVGFAFADDSIDRNKVPYNPVLDCLWKGSRTDPAIIPPEVKVKKDEILNEWYARYSVLSGKTIKSVKNELTNSVASVIIEETFYKVLRHGDFSVSVEEKAENLKRKAISAMNIGVVGHKEISETLAVNVIKAMSATDTHGEAFTPHEYKDFLTLFSDNCGIGVLVKKRQEGVEIVCIQSGGAEKAGLKKGDIITQINGIVLSDLSIYKILPLLKGSINTKVTLLIKRAGTEFFVEVLRSPVKSVSSERYGRVGCIKLTLFTDNVAEEFEDVLLDLLGSGKINSLIIDVRGNPGGSVEETVKILDCLTDKGTLFCLKSGVFIEKVFIASGTKSLFCGKIMVLVDGNSASASEMVAGALQSRGAKIIGEKTYGKGSIQRLFTFPENSVISAIKFTVGRYEIFDLKDKKYLTVDKIGIEPDIKINPNLPVEKILEIPEIREYLGQ